MISFHQFLTEALVASKLKNQLKIARARKALIHVGFQADKAEFSIINNHKQAGVDLHKLNTNRSIYYIDSSIKNVHLIGLAKQGTSEDKYNKTASVYRVAPNANSNVPLYKVEPRQDNDAKSKPLSKEDAQQELAKWDVLLVCTTLGIEDKKEGQSQYKDTADTNNDEKAPDQTKAPAEQPTQERLKDADAEEGKTKTKKDKKGGKKDLGEYLNVFRDKIAKFEGYQLTQLYRSKNDNKIKIGINAGLNDIGLLFVDFTAPEIKNDRIELACTTLTPKAFTSLFDHPSYKDRFKNLLGVRTHNIDQFNQKVEHLSVVMNDLISEMEKAAKVAKIINQIDVQEVPWG